MYAVHDTWATAENVANETVVSRVFSDEEDANPGVPHGISISLPIVGDLNPEKAERSDRTSGVCDRSELRRFAATHVSRRSVIGGTATRARRYTIELIETVQSETGLSYGTAGTLQQTVISFSNVKTADGFPYQYTFGISTPTQPVSDP